MNKEELIEYLLTLSERNRQAIARLLPTTAMRRGTSIEGGNFRLHKNGPGLFKLENDRLSFLLATRSFIIDNNARLAGLFFTSEKNIAGLLKKKKVGLEDMTGLLGDSWLDEDSRAVLEQNGQKEPGGLEALFFRIPRNRLPVVIASLPQNLLAHSLVHFSQRYQQFIFSHTSRRFKRMLADELELLERSEGFERSFEGFYSLLDYERALAELARRLKKMHL